jgi:hypothetical protein
MKIKIDSNHYVKVKKYNDNSNYTYFIHLYNLNEKLPLICNSLHENSTKHDFIEWGKDAIERYNKSLTENNFESFI